MLIAKHNCVFFNALLGLVRKKNKAKKKINVDKFNSAAHDWKTVHNCSDESVALQRKTLGNGNIFSSFLILSVG